MKIRIVHLWLPAAFLYALSVVAAFFQQPLVTILLTVGYMSLLVCSKWAHE